MSVLTQFCVADIEVHAELSALYHGAARQAGGAFGHYHHYPSRGGEPDARVVVRGEPGFRAAEASAPYPGFDVEPAGDDRFRFVRRDAEGTVSIGPPVRAEFRAADNHNAAEAAIRIGVSCAALERGAVIVHASAVAKDGRAHLFAGPSGAGKSTMLELLSAGDASLARISDELVLLAPSGDGYRAHVSPFHGSENLRYGDTAELAAIHFIEHGDLCQRTELSHAEAMRRLGQVVLMYVTGVASAQRILDATAAITEITPCYRLAFTRTPDVAHAVGIA